ncbi:hypothetical protein K432DRAFT_385925 [Lepidopterella palustris CBS 459.81]|uniref:Uncharacterized protein n=1 Tax=Lepidopterella palustris CBS 459.81 TaxID=1314670 RepID=A0A8E2JAV5_9PEZI|nr:hypothetical protein K432DRAFT_385925 [Lepidopterella palustris CBS 459.81]
MGIHAVPFAAYSNTHGSTKIWDPIETLKIINPDRNTLTCVGYAPTCGRRCRNFINQANKATAYQILEELEGLDPSEDDVEAKLRELARYTLCLRYHQNQVDGVVRKWMNGIQETMKTDKFGRKFSVDRQGHLSRSDMEEMHEILTRLLGKTTASAGQSQTMPNYQRRAQEQQQREDENRKAREREQFNDRLRRAKEQLEMERQEREERAEKERQEREQKRREEQKKKQKEREEEERRQKTREEEERRQKRREKEERERKEEERQKKEREAREREERNERVRQRAQRVREERERKEKEQAENEQKEWDQIWLQYSMRWDGLKKSGLRGNSENLRQTIPWPVKSGSWKDVTQQNVQYFFQKALATSDPSKTFKFMQMECLKWHTDRIPKMFGSIEDETISELFNTVAQIAITLRADAASRKGR